MVRHPAHPVRHALRVALIQPLIRQADQARLRVLAIRDLFGILVFQLIQRERTVGGDFPRIFKRLWMVPEQSRHLFRAAQALFGVGLRLFANGVNRPALAHTGQHIRQLPPRSVVHQRLRRRNQRRARALGHLGQSRKPLFIPPVISRGRRQRGQRAAHQPLQHLRRARPLRQWTRRMQQQPHPLAPLLHILHIEMTVALGRPPLADGQQPHQPPPGRAISGQRRHLNPVLQHQPRAGDQLRKRAEDDRRLLTLLRPCFGLSRPINVMNIRRAAMPLGRFRLTQRRAVIARVAVAT